MSNERGSDPGTWHLFDEGEEPIQGTSKSSEIKNDNAPLGYLESSTQCDDMILKEMSSMGTQVDIRSLVSESELNKEDSAEIFWQKMAEKSNAALEEAKDEIKKLKTSNDYLSYHNDQYQRIIIRLKRNDDRSEYTYEPYNPNLHQNRVPAYPLDHFDHDDYLEFYPGQ